MITYPQSTGHINRDGVVIASGYSGHGTGLFNPALQNVHDVGPIPQGRYTLRKVTNAVELRRLKLGPTVFYCEPEGTDWLISTVTTLPWMFGRFAFYIHWDNEFFNYTASHGCIVLLNGWMFTRLLDGEKMVVTA